MRIQVCALVALVACSAWASAAETDAIRFNRDIRPILSDNCFACHGFDPKARKADLRLDTKAGLFTPMDNGTPVVPGKPNESEVLRRILTDDADDLMPPAKSGKKLNAKQKDLLKRWIEQGAHWEDHWSFIRPERPSEPRIDGDTWSRNAVDRFIGERLKREGLTSSQEADRPTLIRRLSLDLTGLPPTPAEVDAFVADKSPDAYEKVVDRLLSSVRYGERMALDWLDAARYADTHGYHIDSGRDMTRWREWVIDAFHKNKPYDQFTIEQLAGDLLPGATLDQKVASGFNRNNMINFEGGAVAEEYRTAYVIDRVNTTTTVWLGLTVACAQCHDHKYDPITQKEFYGLFAFFNSVPERGLDGSKGNAEPMIRTPTREQQAKLAELDASIAEAEKKLAAPSPDIEAEQAAWEKGLAASGVISWATLAATSLNATSGATLKPQEDGSVHVTGKSAPTDVYTIVAPVTQEVTGIRVELLPDATLPGKWIGRSGNGNIVMTEVRIGTVSDAAPKLTTVKVRAASADSSQDSFPVANAVDGRNDTGWAIYPNVEKPHEAVFELETPIKPSPGGHVNISLQFKSQFAQHQPARFRISATSSPAPASGKLPDNIKAIVSVPADQRTAQQKSALQSYFTKNVHAGTRALESQLATLRAERTQIEQSAPSTMVMARMPTPRDTFVLMRGEYDKPGEKVSAGVPAFLPPLPKDAPVDRLALANWLVSRDHPLMARVTVNRYWQMLFGTGLVKTSEDFGVQGESPSHPELLDWLAVQFVESGWDVRALMKLMVMSAAYRQSSAVTRDVLAKDPENRLLARGPRFRLQAELIRDQALAVSGLLDPRVGGASVSPYQPPGLWEELMSRSDGAKWTAQTYVQSHGPDLYRRGMYTFWKRTSPPASMATLDAPDRETCTVRRARTNTPLQALVLMNDPTYVEASRKLAERLMREGGVTSEERITYAYRLVLARSARASEIEILREVLDNSLARFRKDTEAAKKLLSVGESPRDEKLDPSELAAWTTVASTILTLDEAVTKG